MYHETLIFSVGKLLKTYVSFFFVSKKYSAKSDEWMHLGFVQKLYISLLEMANWSAAFV